jgi:hypothetical protein
MGKKSRERKELKIQQTEQERILIEERRRARLAPAYALTKRLIITVLITVLLLYLGIFVSNHLPGITTQILRGQF